MPGDHKEHDPDVPSVKDTPGHGPGGPGGGRGRGGRGGEGGGGGGVVAPAPDVRLTLFCTVGPCIYRAVRMPQLKRDREM